MKHIIGLAGIAGSGKDTVANIIVQSDPRYCRVALADPVRRHCISLYGLDHNKLIADYEYKETIIPRWGLSPRQILQRYGTEVCRAIHPDTWVRYLFECIHQSNFFHFVVPDVRFRNEVDAIGRGGGQVWWVERPGAGSDTGAAHISENSVCATDCDSVLINGGTIHDLGRAVAGLVARL